MSDAGTHPPTSRARLEAAALLALVVLAGLAARAALSGFWAKYLGVALWSCAVYALLLTLAPRLSVRRASALALVISVAVELAQLTPYPRALAGVHVIFALVLGAYFSAWDLPAYAVGVALAALAHRPMRARWRAR